jgi:serine/threonine-protein kinase
MAPEQLADGTVDRRADLFCVGIMGWEALMGRPLFGQASASLTAAAVLDGAIPRIDAEGVPPALVAVIERALAREPHRRPATAAVMREEIEQAMTGVGGVARASEIAKVVEVRCADEIAAQRERVRTASRPVSTTAAASAAAPPTVGARPDAMTTTVWARPMRSRIAWLFAGALAVAVAIGIWIVFGTSSTPRDAGEDAVAAAPADAGAVVAADAGPAAAAAAAAAVEADAGVGGGDPKGKGKGKGGRVSIDSVPWAELFIDDKRVGITPYIDKPLAAGKHRVRAVLEDGRSRTFTIDVPEGRRARPVDLKW